MGYSKFSLSGDGGRDWIILADPPQSWVQMMFNLWCGERVEAVSVCVCVCLGLVPSLFRAPSGLSPTRSLGDESRRDSTVRIKRI